jgi:hypothetical protein
MAARVCCVVTAGSRDFKEVDMAVVFQKSVGLLLLAVWLILYGVMGLVAFVLPAPLMSVLALLAGILILVGR